MLIGYMRLSEADGFQIGGVRRNRRKFRQPESRDRRDSCVNEETAMKLVF